MGRGVENSGGRELDSLLANAVEGVILDLDQDGGGRGVQEAGLGPPTAPSTSRAAQEWSRAELQGVPEYWVLEASGPGHRRHYSVEVRLAGMAGIGEGPPGGRAEQSSARTVLRDIESHAAAAQDVVPG